MKKEYIKPCAETYKVIVENLMIDISEQGDHGEAKPQFETSWDDEFDDNVFEED